MRINITKRVAAGPNTNARAVWAIDGLPGLILHCNYSHVILASSGWRHGMRGWRFLLSSNWSDRVRQAREKGDSQEENVLRLASRLQADLRGQYFSTRREALQAAEVALILVEADSEETGNT